MKKYFTLALIFFSIKIFADPSNYALHTAYSGWGTVTMNNVSLGGIIYPSYTVKATSTDAHYIIEWDSYWNRWYNGGSSLNTIMNLTWTANNNLGDSYFSGSATINKYYTTRVSGLSYSDRKAVVMETSNAPITIEEVENNYSNPGTAVNVSITTSSTPSSEEHIFVRYTTDAWATTGSIIQATGSGTSWSATIPSSGVTGTANNNFYVYTSTLSLTTEQSLSKVDIDLSTLNYNNNGGINFPLPVELTSFAAAVNGNAVNLNWATATERNNYGFDIERASINNSTTGSISFSKIGFIQGHVLSNSTKEYSYTDNTISMGAKYSYRLKQVDNDGTVTYSKIVEVETGNIPNGFVLNQNYPNPFNPTTTIKFGFENPTKATLKVYNTIGNVVATLFNDNAEAGRIYNVQFNASSLSSGVYFYKLTGNNKTEIRKMMLIK